MHIINYTIIKQYILTKIIQLFTQFLYLHKLTWLRIKQQDIQLEQI